MLGACKGFCGLAGAELGCWVVGGVWEVLVYEKMAQKYVD